MIKNFTIYGERCSGTNYLENLMTLNFDIEVTWKYGWKHFPGFNNLSNSEDTLFICIVRNPIDWLNSFYLNPFHLPKCLRENINNFLNNEFWSFDEKDKNTDETKELMIDRNLHTKERYKNVFELRYTKLRYLIEDLPNKVKNYIFIRYEDLVEDFENSMNKIRNCGLNIRENISFPVNTTEYKKEKRTYPKIAKPVVYQDVIINNVGFDIQYEKELGYFI